MSTLLLCLALAAISDGLAQDGGPSLSTWSTRTGVALASIPDTRAQDGGDGSLVGAGRGTSLLLSTDVAPGAARRALDAQLAPFLAAGIAAPPVTDTPCTVAGQASTCLTATLQVAPGASMRLLAGHADVDGWTAVCLDRKGVDRWPAPCDGVIGQQPVAAGAERAGG